MAAPEPPVTDEIDGGYGADLIELTDEELEIIDSRPTEDRLVVSPYVMRLDPSALDLVIATAFRSLLARGMVVAPQPARDRGAPVDVELASPLGELFHARALAPTVVCAHRTTAAGDEYAYWHLPGGETMLEEFVDRDGMHRLRLAEARLLALVVYAYLNPDRVAGKEGGDATVRPGGGPNGRSPALALAQLTEGAVSVAELVVRSAGDEGRAAAVAVAATADGRLLMAETALGSGEPFPVREVAAAGLYDRIEKAVAPSVRPAARSASAG